MTYKKNSLRLTQGYGEEMLSFLSSLFDLRNFPVEKVQLDNVEEISQVEQKKSYPFTNEKRQCSLTKTMDVSSETAQSDNEDELIPRDYQVELWKRAVEENTIIYLPTGAGKTFIAVLILKTLAAPLNKSRDDSKISVVLVNTVTLVDQHAKNLKRLTPFTVGSYSGDMNVDFWCKKKWMAEYNKYQVFVMTTQIFLDVVNRSFLSLERVNLIIFDECHHGVEDHTMRQLMKQFAEVSDKPRVLGLTATLLNKNCKIHKVMEEVKKLEVTYNSRVATAADLQKVYEYSTNPRERIVTYYTHVLSETEAMVVNMLENLATTLSLICFTNKLSREDNLQEMFNGNKSKQLVNCIKDVSRIIERMGSFCGRIALIAFIIHLENICCHSSDSLLVKCLYAIITCFKQSKNMLDVALQQQSQNPKAHLSDQVKTLIEVLKRVKKECKSTFLGIVFVERRSTAKILYNVLQELKKTDEELAFLRPEFIVGFNNNPNNITRTSLYISKTNRRVLDSFTHEDVNLLIATTVIEEGVDVPQCTFVCKFDPPKNYRSYIQSKGRARNKESLFYVMVNKSEHDSFMERFCDFKKIEALLNQVVVSTNEVRENPSQRELEEMYQEDEVPPYFVNGPNSACVTILSAISLLCTYCQTLNSDLYTVQQPKWYLDKSETKMRKVLIQLPTICPLLDTVAGMSRDKKSAKRKAALKACILLHKLGELNDHLIPIDRNVIDDVDYLFPHWPKSDGKFCTPKNRTNHEKQEPLCTRGFFDVNKPMFLHVIKLEPRFDPECTKSTMLTLYSSDLTYGLVSTKRLPNICDFPVYVKLGEIRVSLLANYKTVSLNNEQLESVRKFNFLIFNDVLQILKTFLVIDLADEANKMFCVPICRDKDYDIDFNVMSNNEALRPVMEPSRSEKLQLIVNKETYHHKIVTPWYRSDNTDYVVDEVTNLDARSEFPSEVSTTFAQYFESKYVVNIANPKNSLLLVTGITRRLNCIKPRGARKLKRKLRNSYEDAEIHLIPELCIKQEFPASLWLQAKILPTILERISRLLLFDELRTKINSQADIGAREENRIWEPLTLMCSEHYQKPETVDSAPLVNLRAIESAPVVEIIKYSTWKLNKEYKSKMLEKEYPWSDKEEPVDIERNLDVNLLDIQNYAKFMNTKVTTVQRELKNNIQHNTLSIEYRQDFTPKRISSISNRSSAGPELREIFEALCTAKANDIVNLERYETLGDSFLKLIVSLYITLKFPKYDEGKATILKSKLISNNNLYYAGVKKELGGILKGSDFEPKAQWVPPGFTVPSAIKNAHRNRKFNVKHIHKVSLSIDEQIDGVLSAETEKLIFSDLFANEGVEYSQEDHSSIYFFGHQEVAYKTVADAVESLLGVYYKSCGFAVAVKLIEWFEIIPKSVKLHELLKTAPGTPILNPNATQKDVDFHIPSWKQLEGKLGYSFKDRAYLLQALTHSSYSPNRITRSYETLEFIGDAVLDFLITCFIFESCGTLNPGELTDLRSALVNNITFACYTVRCEFHKYLLSLNPKLQADIDKFALYQENNGFAVTDNVLILINEEDIHIAENVDCPKILGDIFESLVGAVYLDSGYDLNVVWDVFYRIMWQEIDLFSKNVPKNVVRLLYETPCARPKFSESIAVDRAIMIKLDFMVDGAPKRVYGFGDNKKNAKKAASKIALRVING